MCLCRGCRALRGGLELLRSAIALTIKKELTQVQPETSIQPTEPPMLDDIPQRLERPLVLVARRNRVAFRPRTVLLVC